MHAAQEGAEARLHAGVVALVVTPSTTGSATMVAYGPSEELISSAISSATWGVCGFTMPMQLEFVARSHEGRLTARIVDMILIGYHVRQLNKVHEKLRAEGQQCDSCFPGEIPATSTSRPSHQGSAVFALVPVTGTRRAVSLEYLVHVGKLRLLHRCAGGSCGSTEGVSVAFLPAWSTAAARVANVGCAWGDAQGTTTPSTPAATTLPTLCCGACRRRRAVREQRTWVQL